MLIQIKNYSVLDMPDLMRAALKFIYDRDNMPAADVEFMQHSIVAWKKAIDLETEKAWKIIEANLKAPGGPIETQHKYSEQQEWLEKICGLLQDDADGKLEKRKMSFAEHGIDYRKFHRLPEMYTEESKAKAQADYEEYACRNPEQEGLVKPGKEV